jgi:hypothetical protein
VARELCFAGAAILKDGCLPQIPRLGKHKSLLMWSVLYAVCLMLVLNHSLLDRGDWKSVKITLQPSVSRPVSFTPGVDFVSLYNDILDHKKTSTHRGCFADARERSSMDGPRRNVPQTPSFRMPPYSLPVILFAQMLIVATRLG